MTDAQPADWLKLGVAAARSGDRPAAREYLENALRDEPRNELAWFWYAGVVDDPSETIEALGYVLEINPGNERALVALRQARLQLGIAEVRKGNRDRGRELLDRCAEEDPQNELVWLWLSGLTDSPDAAIRCLQRALEINPANERARAGMDYYKARLEPVRPPWQCPICQHTAMNKQVTCPGCGCILTLADVDSVLNNGGADEESIRLGISRLLGRARVKPDFTIHCYIGLAFLNLRQIPEAMNQFQAGLRLQENDALRQQLQVLEQRRIAQERHTQRIRVRTPEQSRRVLMVDPSSTLRKIVGIIADRFGVQFSEAIDLEEGLEKIHQEGCPDLILLSPEDARPAGLRRLRREGLLDLSHSKVVVLTRQEGFVTRLRWRLTGVAGAIPKPFHPDAVVGLLRAHRLLPETSSV